MAEVKKDEKEDQEEPKETKEPRPPSKKQVDEAKLALVEAKADPATWAHVEKLFAATESPERACAKKYHFWLTSMYWGTRRVGLLQKKAGQKSINVLSFGGGFCKHIGIPAEACQLFVGPSVDVVPLKK